MPIINGQEYTPDAAIASDYCPECGADFRVTNPHAHRLTHWRRPAPLGAEHDETRRRIALFDDYLKTHAPLSRSGLPPELRAGTAPARSSGQEAQS